MPWPIGLRDMAAGPRCAARPSLHRLLELGRQAEPAAALVEVDPGQPGVELRAEELLGAVVAGRVVGQQGLGGLADPLLVGVGGRLHGTGGDVGHGPHLT